LFIYNLTDFLRFDQRDQSTQFKDLDHYVTKLQSSRLFGIGEAYFQFYYDNNDCYCHCCRFYVFLYQHSQQQNISCQ